MRLCVLIAIGLVACSAQPAITAEVTPVMSACRLPVMRGPAGQGSGLQTPGFLDLPAGTFSKATNATADAQSYDAVLKRWVPVGQQAITPDGLRYVYADHNGAASIFHLVELRTGEDRAIGQSGQWVGAGLNNIAIYAMRVEFTDSVAYGRIEVSKGLWSIPLDGGPSTQLTSDSIRWQWADKQFLYGAGSTADVAGVVSPILRLDLKTTLVAPWFDSPGRVVALAVDAAGTGFAVTDAGDEELWRIPAEGEPAKVWSGPIDVIRPGGPVAVDGEEIWFRSSSLRPEWAIFHFSPRQGLQKVADFTDRPVTVAGACA